MKMWKVRLIWSGPGMFDLHQQTVYITADDGEYPDLNAGGIPEHGYGDPRHIEIVAHDADFLSDSLF